MTNPKTRIAFDKRIEAESTAAGSFDKAGAYVIVFYYYGQADARTAVAVKSLGAGPFGSVEGTVTKFDRAHSISVQGQYGRGADVQVGRRRRSPRATPARSRETAFTRTRAITCVS